MSKVQKCNTYKIVCKEKPSSLVIYCCVQISPKLASTHRARTTSIWRFAWGRGSASKKGHSHGSCLESSVPQTMDLSTGCLSPPHHGKWLPLKLVIQENKIEATISFINQLQKSNFIISANSCMFYKSALLVREGTIQGVNIRRWVSLEAILEASYHSHIYFFFSKRKKQ